MRYSQIWAIFLRFRLLQLKWTYIAFLGCHRTLFISTMILRWWNPFALHISYLLLIIINSTDPCQFNAMTIAKTKRSQIKFAKPNVTHQNAITMGVIVKKSLTWNLHLSIKDPSTRPALTSITYCWTRISVQRIEEWFHICHWLGLFSCKSTRRVIVIDNWFR